MSSTSVSNYFLTSHVDSPFSSHGDCMDLNIVFMMYPKETYHLHPLAYHLCLPSRLIWT
ncbi:hypothetical protein BDR07DRAFT_1433735 [Suillus spraguei]|nr:hypothetical protein BDR07DRAFT_1433735 [Suillus spraguei]